jgi:ubiquinone/menaquinone biosynthesis C-methylase UbiE
MIVAAKECRTDSQIVDREELIDVLLSLYKRQLRSDDHRYLADHARMAWVRGHVRVFDWYSKYLRQSSRILDWGCHHGPDSCLLKARFGEDVELHGCDFHGMERFSVFREFCGMQYRQLHDPFHLPYEDEQFDTLIASGMLEHAAMDNECLKEAYRILKPGGRLVVTYLPNEWSLQEWRLRSRGADAHLRRYTRHGFTRQLLHHGFLPVAPVRAQFFRWERGLEICGANDEWIDFLSRLGRTLFPIHVLASTWCTVAEKRLTM